MALAELPPASGITVEVVVSPGPRAVRQVTLSLGEGATVREALLASGLADPLQADLTVGIWGRRASLGMRLRDRDRVEVYRALTVDPKEARRVRQRAHDDKLPKGRYRPKSSAKV